MVLCQTDEVFEVGFFYGFYRTLIKWFGGWFICNGFNAVLYTNP